MASTPAGQLEEFPRVRRIYDRLATQGSECAEAWVAGRPCPPHEAGVAAFWWAVAAWAGAFLNDVLEVSPYIVGLDQAKSWLFRQVAENFYQPHVEFARYLRSRPSGVIAYWRDVSAMQNMSPGEMVLAHDAKWTALGVRLAVRWHPLYLVTEFRTIREAIRLSGALRKPFLNDVLQASPSFVGLEQAKDWLSRQSRYNPIARAYLQSDLVFLRQFFAHFSDLFPDDLNRTIGHFLDSVETELVHSRLSQLSMRRQS
jgi:hypothetical protein